MTSTSKNVTNNDCWYPSLRQLVVLIVAGLCAYSLLSTREFLEFRGVVSTGHGWPIVYVKRQIPANRPWSRYAIWNGIYEFHPLGLFKDGLISTVFGVAVVLLLNGFSSRRKPCSVRTLLLLTAVICVILAWYKSWWEVRKSQKEVLTKLEESGWRTGFSNDLFPWYLEPLRDLGVLHYDDCAYFALEWDSSADDGIETLGAHTTTLTLVRSVLVFSPTLDDQGLKLLAIRTPNLTSLHLGDCPGVTNEGAVTIATEFSRLREIRLEGTRVTNKGAMQFIELPFLEYLWIEDPANRAVSFDFSQFSKCNQLKTIGIPLHWVDSRQSIELLERQEIKVVRTPQRQLDAVRDW